MKRRILYGEKVVQLPEFANRSCAGCIFDTDDVDCDNINGIDCVNTRSIFLEDTPDAKEKYISLRAKYRITRSDT